MPKIEIPKSQQDYYRQAIGNHPNYSINPRISQAIQASDQANKQANKGLLTRFSDELIPRAVSTTVKMAKNIPAAPIRLGASMADLPNQAMGGQPMRPFNLPFLGEQKTYARQFIDDTPEMGAPAAIIGTAAQAAGDIATTAGIGQGIGSLAKKGYQYLNPSAMSNVSGAQPSALDAAEANYQHMFGKTPNPETLQSANQANQNLNLSPVEKAIEQFKYNTSAQLRAQGEPMQASWVDSLNPHKFPDYQDFEDTIINAMQTASSAAKNTLGNHLQTSGQILHELIKGGGKLISALNPLQPQEAQAMRYIDPESGQVTDTYHKYKTIRPLPGGGTQTYESTEDRLKDAAQWNKRNAPNPNWMWNNIGSIPGTNLEYPYNQPISIDRTKQQGFSRDDIPLDLGPMSAGSQGDQVSVFQKYLVAHGLLEPEFVTGTFNPATQEGTKLLQIGNNMPPTGKLDSNTQSLVEKFAKHDRMEFFNDQFNQIMKNGAASPPYSVNAPVPLNPLSPQYTGYEQREINPDAKAILEAAATRKRFKNTLRQEVASANQKADEANNSLPILKSIGEAINPFQPNDAQAMKYYDSNGQVADTYHKYKTVKDLGNGVTQTTETPENRANDASQWAMRFQAQYQQGTMPPPDNLVLGSKGDSVLRIQNWLRDLGFMTNNDVSGIYDKKTQESVKAWQKLNNTPQTGNWDDTSKRNWQYFWNHDNDEFKKDTGQPNPVYVSQPGVYSQFTPNPDANVRGNPNQKGFVPYDLGTNYLGAEEPAAKVTPQDIEAALAPRLTNKDFEKYKNVMPAQTTESLPAITSTLPKLTPQQIAQLKQRGQWTPALEAEYNPPPPPEPMGRGLFGGMKLGQTKDIYQQKGILPKK